MDDVESLDLWELEEVKLSSEATVFGLCPRTVEAFGLLDVTTASFSLPPLHRVSNTVSTRRAGGEDCVGGGIELTLGVRPSSVVSLEIGTPS
jgi:hypothetical protein